MPLLSLDAACCAAYLTISAKKPSPDAKCGVVFSFMRESGHGEDKTELIVRKIMSGSLLEAAGLKVGDRVMDLCNQKPRSAQEAASLLRNAESTIEMTIERNSTKVTHIADLNPLQGDLAILADPNTASTFDDTSPSGGNPDRTRLLSEILAAKQGVESVNARIQPLQDAMAGDECRSVVHRNRVPRFGDHAHPFAAGFEG